MYYKKLTKSKESGVLGCLAGPEFQDVLPNACFGEFSASFLGYFWQILSDRQIAGQGAHSHLSVSGANANYFAVGKGVG